MRYLNDEPGLALPWVGETESWAALPYSALSGQVSALEAWMTGKVTWRRGGIDVDVETELR